MATRTRRTAPDRLTEALTYLAHGLHPIPVRPAGKAPALARGEIHQYRERPPMEAELRRWCGSGRPYNIGLVTGPDAGGLAVVDIDGPTGEASLQGLDLPRTPTVLTSSGHRHLYYYAAEEIPTRRGLRPGVDLVAMGGLIVAPTSVHPSGAVYRWARGRSLDDVPMARLPGWVFAILDSEAVENPYKSLILQP